VGVTDIKRKPVAHRPVLAQGGTGTILKAPESMFRIGTTTKKTREEGGTKIIFNQSFILFSAQQFSHDTAFEYAWYKNSLRVGGED